MYTSTYHTDSRALSLYARVCVKGVKGQTTKCYKDQLRAKGQVIKCYKDQLKDVLGANGQVIKCYKDQLKCQVTHDVSRSSLMSRIG